MTKITLPTEKTPWEILSAIDLTDKIEKKNGLSYISWAWAWGELKRHYPHAWYRKHEGANGYPCFYDVQGYAFVKVTVGLDKTTDHEVTEMMPVLDHRNKPIQGPNAFDVNNALQRCLAKAIAYHGLGHYIYAGEDLPQEVQAEAQNMGGSQHQGVSAPGQASTPSSVPHSEPTAPTVFAADGKVAAQTHAVETIVATFMAFIPTCTDQKTLTAFYSVNKGARNYLAEKDKAAHDQVVAAFSEAKKKLASAGAEPETQG